MGRDQFANFILRAAVFVLLGCGVAGAMAQGDPPARVARINYSEGVVAWAPSGEKEWTDAETNRPLSLGDKLWTDKGVRAEIQVGSSAVRMDGRTRLTVLALDDQSAQWSVTQGTVYVRVRNLPEGENFEIDTPNLAYRAAYPGDYRIDVDPQRGVTRVTIHSGTGAVYGEKGEVLTLGGGQQITFKGRALEKVNVQEQPPQDNFDRWAAERIRREEQSVAARYVPREVVGYQALDASGEWRNDGSYGPVWYPQGMAATWAPYRNGRWEWIVPWGWTWIDEAPWAFVTSHYGRWAMVGTRWAWVPGRLGLRPVYAPALVAFVGNGSAPFAVGGRPAVAWFPLAPGEAWQPSFRATPLYISTANANMPPVKEGGYAFQHKPEALTALAADDFQHGKPAKGNWLRMPAVAVAAAQVAAAPAAPERPRATAVARAAAPAQAPEVRQVTASGPTLQQQLEARKAAQQQAQLQAQRDAEAQKQRAAEAEQARVQREQQAKAEQARRSDEQKAAEQKRIAEQLRVAEQARRTEQQRTAERQQRLAEQTRRAEQQKVAEQQRKADQQRVAERQRAVSQQQARAEAARAAVDAKRAVQAELARREAVAARKAEAAKRDALAAREREHERQLQARREQEARRVAAAQAKKDEQARRIAHAQQVEQARRAADRDAQVLAQQRAEREAAAARKVAEDRERAQREAAQKQQQALAEQFRRDQQSYEDQQRPKQPRGRPDLRRAPPNEPEVWQRGIPILAPGRTS